MKNEFEIEKVYRVKGDTKCFTTGKEAVEYAKNDLAQKLKSRIHFEENRKKDYVQTIKKERKMLEEAKGKTVDLREVWEIVRDANGRRIYSKGANLSVVIPQDLDLYQKMDLIFARQFILFFCKNHIKGLEEDIRERKRAIKELQRRYSAIMGVK